MKDSDGDGLLDVWESSTTPIYDPRGKPLPLLSAMVRRPGAQGHFRRGGFDAIERRHLHTVDCCSRPIRTFLPQAALKLVGDAFKECAGSDRGALRHGQRVPAAKTRRGIGRGVPDSRTIGQRGRNRRRTDDRLHPQSHLISRGSAEFAKYPGTVGWKTGFRFLRDEVLSVTPPAGEAAPPAGEEFCDTPGYTCNRRFDRNRKDMFRYALFAHALGIPKSEDPASPDFHVPRTNTGVADFPGGDSMVTLGAFADTAGRPVGTPFMQASTLMHELGHDFERRHGGDALEPNCKPTYLSVMNYLYQLRGLLDDAGRPHLDFSG